MIGSLLTRIRRRRSPVFLMMKRVVQGLRSSRLPLPDFLRPVLRIGFYAQHATLTCIRWLLAVLIYEPLFSGRCSAAGKRLRIYRMPFVIGPTAIHIGDDVNFFGNVEIARVYV
jgi:hypothetical protein